METDTEQHAEERSWLYQPSFPEGWTHAPLYSLANWVNGLAFRDLQFSKSGMPVIKIAEIKGGITGQTKFTTQTFDEKVRVRPGDMLFSWSGQPETSIDVFRWDGPEGWLNQHVFRVTAKEEVLPEFLFYLLRYLKPSFIGIAKNKQTTGLGHVTKRDLERMVAAYPTKEVQQEIAATLWAIDGRIDSLRRANEILEEMARVLFQSWFIDFDPVRAKAKGREPFGMDEYTSALFPDSLNDSPVGPIPLGWEVKTLKQLTLLITKGTTPTQSDINNASQTEPQINYVRVNSIDDGGFVLSDKLTKIPESVHRGVLKRSILGMNDILYTIAGTIGRISIVEEWLLPANTNQAVAILRPKPSIPAAFFVLTMQNEEFRKELHNNIVQAVQANLSLGMLSNARAVVPPENILREIFTPIESMFEQISVNRDQIRTLVTLRETLLPKLFNGELSVLPFAEEAEPA
jgi:type I restriction enzyme S subunit